MQSTLLLRSVGLIMLGFIAGIIFSGLGTATQQEPASINTHADYSHADLGGQRVNYLPLAYTGHWDIGTFAQGKQLAVGRDGRVQVVIIADKSALHVLTYGQNDALWEGRLVDFDGDGSIEVADISGGHCENFDR